MGKPRTIPLASGLIGQESGSMYGQLEVTLTDFKTVHILIRRKPYSGESNIKLSMPFTDLKEIIIILGEAHEKLNDKWLSMIATKELSAHAKLKVHT